MAKFKNVEVKFKDSNLNYSSFVNPESSDESIRNYFVGTRFNVGEYPTEKFAKCIEVEISTVNFHNELS